MGLEGVKNKLMLLLGMLLKDSEHVFLGWGILFAKHSPTLENFFVNTVAISFPLCISMLSTLRLSTMSHLFLVFPAIELINFDNF